MDTDNRELKHDDSLRWQQVQSEERVALGLAAVGGSVGPQRVIAGLALSGGGIRSATFCLGVIQALAASRKLSRFDYLSTVSGGGYIGSWLSAFIKRRANQSIDEAERLLAHPATTGDSKRAATRVDISSEDPAIQWLRSYSNYLTPRVGFAGVDTWTAISTYLRNLTLNWLVLLPLAVSAILALALVLPLSQVLQRAGGWLLVAAFGAISGVAFAIGRGIDLPRANVKPSTFREPSSIVLWCGAGTLLAAWLAALGLGAIEARWHQRDALTWLLWVAAAMAANIAAWSIAGSVRRAGRIDGKPPALKTPDFESGASLEHQPLQWIVISVLPGVMVGVMSKLWADARTRWVDTFEWLGLAPTAFDVVIGMPVMMLLIANAVLLFIGMAKRRMSETDREWLGRLGAILFLLGIAWLLAFAMLWLGAVMVPLFKAGSHWWVGVGAGAWLLQTVVAVVLGKGALTGASNGKSKPKIEALIALTPYFFFAGLVALIGWASLNVLAWGHGFLPYTDSGELSVKAAINDATGATLALLNAVGSFWLAAYASAMLAVALFMSWRVDVNLFSYNRFYGNRLARAYLGAARERNLADTRQAHPFTNFDPDDDVTMASMANHQDGKPIAVQRPLHIINTALNLTGSPELAWQSRKSASFTFTPLHCGFALPRSATLAGVTPLEAIEGYRRSFEYGSVTPTRDAATASGEINDGVTLSMAFPTSGAAASPNMGSHSSPALAMLLTLFNVRLGRWFGNPRDSAGAWRKRTPNLSLQPLLSELLGSADFRKPWLYLSDGGHFENLGIYELVRRRVPLIVAIDAAQDEQYTFTDLANAIRLCSTDFGVTITITDPLQALRPSADTRISERDYLFGSVNYPVHNDEAAFTGTLLFVKPVLLADLPADVFEYAQRGSGFPQETTGDQWFSEAQFESYRHLGEIIAGRLCRDPKFTALF